MTHHVNYNMNKMNSKVSENDERLDEKIQYMKMHNAVEWCWPLKAKPLSWGFYFPLEVKISRNLRQSE